MSFDFNRKTGLPTGVKVINEKEGIVGAFVAVIGNKDSVGDIIQPGAFDTFLANRKPKGVWAHDWDKPIAKTLNVFEVKAGDPMLPARLQANGYGALYVEMQFNLNTTLGKEAFDNVMFYGDECEWSIGYKTHNEEWDSKAKANLLHEVELFEYSFVLFGANPLTSTLFAKVDDNGDVVVKTEGIPDELIPSIRNAIKTIIDNPGGVMDKDTQVVDEATEDVENSETTEKSDVETVDSDVSENDSSVDAEKSDDTDETDSVDENTGAEPDETDDVGEPEEKSETVDDVEADETVETEETVDEKEAQPRARNKSVDADIEKKALPGSYEERYSILSEAIYEEYKEVGYAYVYATFDDSIVFYLYDRKADDHGYWRATYEISDGVASFGDKQAVDIVEVLVLKTMLEEMISRKFESEVLSVIEEVLGDEKAGRVLSSSNRNLLKEAVDKIAAVLDADDTEEKSVEVDEVAEVVDEVADDLDEKDADDTDGKTVSVDANTLRVSLADFYATITQ